MTDFIINDGVLIKCKNNIKNALLSTEVKVVGAEAFTDITELRTIQFPDGFTKIDEKAFCNCTSLSRVIIPDSLTTIENSAFFNCINLDSNTKEKIKSINPLAF